MDIYSSKFIQNFRDIKFFFKFRKEMKRESKLLNSKFTKYKLKINKFGNILYLQLNCSDEDLMNANYDIERMLTMKLKPIIDYLTELDWGDYLKLQIVNFYDEENDMPTLSYGVEFVYDGYSMTMTKAFWMLILSLVLLGGGIWALIHFLC